MKLPMGPFTSRGGFVKVILGLSYSQLRFSRGGAPDPVSPSGSANDCL